MATQRDRPAPRSLRSVRDALAAAQGETPPTATTTSKKGKEKEHHTAIDFHKLLINEKEEMPLWLQAHVSLQHDFHRAVAAREERERAKLQSQSQS